MTSGVGLRYSNSIFGESATPVCVLCLYSYSVSDMPHNLLAIHTKELYPSTPQILHISVQTNANALVLHQL